MADFEEDIMGVDESAEGSRVRCRECGNYLGQITTSHLSKHGMTMSEYRDKHPDAEVQPELITEEVAGFDGEHDEETRAKISEGVKEANNGS